MFRFKVDGTSYQLPQTPYEVTYKQGIQIRELEKTFGGINYGYKLNVLQMLSGCDRLGEVVEEEINAIYKGLPLFSSETGIGISDVIRMNKKLYGLVDLNSDSFTTEQYIDIEQLLSNAEDLHDIASCISAMLYRPVKSVRTKFLNRIINFRIRFIKSRFIKPYSCVNYEIKGRDLKEADSRVNEIEDCFSWGHAISCLAYYMSWKQDLAKRFHLLFPEPRKRNGKAEEVNPDSMSSVWGLYHQLALMTERDLDKIDSYKSKPITKVMYHLSYCVKDNESREK